MVIEAVQTGAERGELIAEFLKSGEIFHPLRLTAGEAYTFLKEVPLYEEAGELEITNGAWLASVIESLVRPGGSEAVTCGEDFHASPTTWGSGKPSRSLRS